VRAALALLALLAAALPAWAQHKCVDAKGKISYSEQPCAAGQKSGAITRGAASGGSAAAAAGGGGAADVLVTYYDVYGVTAEALNAAIKAKGPKGYGSFTDSKVSYTYQSQAGPTGCRVQTLDTELAITMTLPRWVQAPGAVTPALAASWERYLAALRAHESAHIDLIRRLYTILRAGLAETTAPTCGELEAALRGRYDAVMREGQRVNDEYDRQTDHGRAQGATL
jgi:predicted secreted Zn-dependent protease